MEPKAYFSVPSLIAIVCAIGSFFVGVGAGFALAIIAIILGAIGLIIAMMPGVRGGLISMVSIAAGGIGIVAAIFKLIG